MKWQWIEDASHHRTPWAIRKGGAADIGGGESPPLSREQALHGLSSGNGCFRDFCECQNPSHADRVMAVSRMKLKLLSLSALLALATLAMSEEESLKIEGAPDPVEVAADAAGPGGEVPDDLLDDAHLKEELAVNKFTAPSISRLFDTLQFLMPLPLAEVERQMPARMSQDRADLAIELGFLIADGFLMESLRIRRFVEV